MPRGRPLGPRNAGFSFITNEHGNFTYALQFANGVVKVGYSRRPRSRIIQLAAHVGAAYRTQIVRVHIQPTEWNPFGVESRVLQRLKKIAVLLPGRLEYFTDVDFGLVVNLLKQQARLCSLRALAA